MKIPGPEHPISVEPDSKRVRVRVAGQLIADSTQTLSLREATYPAVRYIPRSDVKMAALERTTHSSHCPYKGDASYFSIPGGGARAVNAVWTYENPYPSVASIKDYLAFYPDRVDGIDVEP